MTYGVEPGKSTAGQAGDGARNQMVRLTIPAKAEYITLCRLALTGLARVRPLTAEQLADLKLALTEATSNSVRHAYPGDENGHVEVSYELRPDRIVIEVVDDGEGFDPEVEISTVVPGQSEGGLGIAIIRAIGDEFSLESRTGARGSRLRFAKVLSH
jgi:serine/threonine-protein kinase RsbW